MCHEVRVTIDMTNLSTAKKGANRAYQIDKERSKLPREARIGAPGALHYIVLQGIERKEIVEHDKDRDDFVERLSGLRRKMVTLCYLCSLMTNHVYLLLRTGTAPIASITR